MMKRRVDEGAGVVVDFLHAMSNMTISATLSSETIPCIEETACLHPSTPRNPVAIVNITLLTSHLSPHPLS